MDMSRQPILDKQDSMIFNLITKLFFRSYKQRQLDLQGKLNAIDRSIAVIEYAMDGTILTANDNFLNLMGYSLSEIQGKNHNIFVEELYRQSPEYKYFWEKLNRGEFESAELKRFAKGGREVWVQATYNPVLGENGKPVQVISLATDISARKSEMLEVAAKLEAIDKSQAVIEFAMDGTILTANDNFLSLMGYGLAEITGKHHGIFVGDEYRVSAEYKAFWEKLNRGEFESAEFERFAKDGSSVWIQATYTPILDINNKPIKVVKFATDITDRKNTEAKFKKITQDLQARITEYRDFIAHVTEGDLTHHLDISGDDDLSKLGYHLQDMTQGLSDIASKIIHVTQSIAVNVEQLNKSVSSQSSSAAEQATAVTEIGNIVEEITQTSQQTLEKAVELGKSAKQTLQEGERGSEMIKKVLISMGILQEKIQQIAETILGLSDKTQQVGEITEAVSDIAKQSKMLALNASIEAAKAGESGKGFAVVADEVKALADRSQKATKNVQDILQDIRKTAEHAVMVTEEGTKSVSDNLDQAENAGDIIEKLGEVIKISSSSAQEIESAVRDESLGIEQVVTSIREIDKAADNVNKTTGVTKDSILDVAKTADTLKATVSKYKVKSTVVNDE